MEEIFAIIGLSCLLVTLGCIPFLRYDCKECGGKRTVKYLGNDESDNTVFICKDCETKFI